MLLTTERLADVRARVYFTGTGYQLFRNLLNRSAYLIANMYNYGRLYWFLCKHMLMSGALFSRNSNSLCMQHVIMYAA